MGRSPKKRTSISWLTRPVAVIVRFLPASGGSGERAMDWTLTASAGEPTQPRF
jgi:hypothetical protein